MKRSFVIVLLTCAAAMANPTKDPLIGHWRTGDQKLGDEHTFRVDGTFAGHVTEDGKVAWQYSGKWSLVGNILNFEYTKSSLERIPVGTTDREKLIEITKDYYVIEERDGNRDKYSRVK
jgi:hypothetical protein